MSETHAVFHKLWSRAIDAPNYVKDDWNELGRLLNAQETAGAADRAAQEVIRRTLVARITELERGNDPQEPITLQELTSLLEDLKPDEHVYYDFGGTVPTTFDSYRGYYEQLALGWSPLKWCPETSEYNHRRAEYLLFECRQALKNPFYGYKGGVFTMHAETPLWVDNNGACSGVAIIGMRDNTILTKMIRDY